MKQLYVFVETSSVRKRVLQAFRGKKKIVTPAKISRETGLFPSMISTALRQLESANLIVCLTPNKKSWKAFEMTELGKQLATYTE